MLWESTSATRSKFPDGRSDTTYIPMTSGGGYIVVAALSGATGQPDLSTVRAFLATSAQGVSFGKDVWRKSCLGLY